MKIGMNLLLWATHVTEEHYPHLERIKEAGFDGVEVPVFEGDPGHYAKTRKVLDDLELGCTTVTVSTPDANPISPDAKIRAAAVDDLKRKIERSAILGSDVLCGPFHQALGEFSGTGPTDDEKKNVTDVHRAAAEAAEKSNVRLGIEALNRFECYFANTAEDIVAHVKRVDHPSFGALYDTFHSNIEEKDPVAAYSDYADYYFQIHVSENDRGTPGKGHVPFLDTFRAIRAAGYDRWLTIESFGRALPDLAAATRVWRDFFSSPEEVYREGIQFIKKTWAEAGG